MYIFVFNSIEGRTVCWQPFHKVYVGGSVFLVVPIGRDRRVIVNALCKLSFNIQTIATYWVLHFRYYVFYLIKLCSPYHLNVNEHYNANTIHKET